MAGTARTATSQKHPRLHLRSSIASIPHAKRAIFACEAWFLGAEAKLNRQRLDALPPIVDSAMSTGRASVIVPGEAEHNILVRDLAKASWMWGWAHGHADMGEFHFNDGPRFPVGPQPAEAIKYAESRVALAGKWSRDLDHAVTSIIAQGLAQGKTNKDVMAALAQVFPSFSKARLETIARTESMMAYNHGRLSAYKANRLIVAVQFTAILDARTTNICRSRDGLIMRLDDERLDANTPPLHYNCRSTLVPVDKYDWEDLQDGDARATKRFFGWTGDAGPKTLHAATHWDALPKPLAGFGDLGDT